jgi:PAS domain S-box-containing protein
MSSGRTRRIVWYGFAVLASGVALLVQLGLTRTIGPGLPTFLLFYPIVMFSAMLYGLGPGLLATAVSALLAAYFILPSERFAVGSPVDLLGLVIFAWMGTGISLVAGWYHRARNPAADSAPAPAGPLAEEGAPHQALHRLEAAPGPVPRRAPLRRWLTLLVLGTAGPLLGFAIVVLVWLVGGYRTDQDRRHMDTTRALALAVDAEIRSWKAELQTLAESNDLHLDRLAAFYHEAQVVATRHEGWIVLTDASGQQQMNTRRAYGAPLPKAGPPETVQAVFRSGQPVVTDLVFGAVAQHYIVAVMVPVMREGHVLYSLDLAFAPERLTRLLAAPRFPAPWVVAITDGQQKVIAHVPERPDRIGQPVLAPFARAFAAQDSGLVEATITDGRVGRSAFQHLREARWAVNVMVLVTELQSAWQRPVLAFLLLGGLAVFGAVGLAVGLARKIAQPVTEAARVAGAVVHGEAPNLPPSRIAEVAVLQDALADSAATVRTATQAREEALTTLHEVNATLEQRVTDRTAALQRSEYRFRRFYESGLLGVIYWTMDGVITDANDKFLEMVGYSREELAAGRIDWVHMTPPEYRHLDEASAKELKATGVNKRPFEKEYIRKDGSRIPVIVAGAMLEEARVNGVAFVLDITTRKQAEEALRTSERLYRAIGESIAYGVWVCAPDGRNIYASESFLTLVGITQEQCSSFGWGDVLHPDDAERTLSAWKECVRAGGPWDIEHRFRGADGQWHPILARGVPVRDERGQITCWAGINLDISRRKQVEAALQQANEDLEQRVQARTAELSRTLQQLSVQSEQLRALASELTLAEQRERLRLAEQIHDGLQQLLVAARYRVTHVGRGDVSTLRQDCEAIVQLLDEAVADSRSLTAELSPPILRTGGLLDGLEWLARWSQEKHHLTVQVQAPAAALPPLPEDLTVLLFQSVRELLFNVVKYAQVSEAAVTLTWDPPGLTLTVTDTGAGFTSSPLRGEGGVAGGFGLARIRHRLELLGGCLTVDSAPGQGTRVTLAVLLPTAAQPAASPVAPEVMAAPERALAPDPGSPRAIRILLADDHQVVRRALAQMLGAEADLTVVGEAGTGTAAVALAHELSPDVVLMDINMPEMNGIDATRAIHGTFPAMRVIGLSMFDPEEQQAAIQAAGAVAYVSKSAPAEALLAAIRGGR